MTGPAIMEYRVISGITPITDWQPSGDEARRAAVDMGYAKRGKDGKIYLPAAASIEKRPRNV